MPDPAVSNDSAHGHSMAAVFMAFLKLGLTSFGGPVAHLGYFHDEFVVRRKWLDAATYADIVALCQLLPGPASSQVGLAIGITRAGIPGAIGAWLGFTTPSALAMIVFAYGVTAMGDLGHRAWLHGLQIVAVAVVAQALWSMARSLCPDRERITLAIGAAVLMLAIPSPLTQIAGMAIGALLGWLLLPGGTNPDASSMTIRLNRGISYGALAVFLLLLIGLPFLADITSDQTLRFIDSFYRSGSLVFGGGHVVLPLLQQEVVRPGWIDNDAFLAGYGAAQAVPGPLFTFAAYLGAAMTPQPYAWFGGLICLAAIFLPSFLLVIGILPFWNDLRRLNIVQSALKGINAAVVGLLLAALYTPVWTSAIKAPRDFLMGIVAFLLLAFWKTPPWFVVLLGALGASAAAWNS